MDARVFFDYCATNVTFDVEPRVVEAKFGDGYAQRRPDGINTEEDEIQLELLNRLPGEAKSILAFLSERKGVEVFSWRTPRGMGEVLSVYCPSWSWSYADMVTGGERLIDIHATFTKQPSALALTIPHIDYDFTTGVLPAGVSFARASTATFISAAGQLVQVAANVPRFVGSGASVGLMVEPSSTNVLTSTGQPHLVAGSQLIGDSNPYIFAGNTMKRVIPNTAMVTHYWDSLMPGGALLPASSVFSGQLVVRAGEMTTCTFNAFSGAAGGLFSFGLDLVSGATAGVIPAGTTMTTIADGVWLVKIPNITTAASGTNGTRLRVIPTQTLGGSATYEGDGVSGLYVGGCQIEQRARCTSFIPTITDQVNRPRDNVSASATSWFDSSLGTMFADVSTEGGIVDTGAVMQLDDGTASNRHILVLGNPGASSQIATIITNNVTTFNVGGLPLMGRNRIAMSYNYYQAQAAINGQASNIASNVTLPTGITSLRIGGNSGQNWNGIIHRISYMAAPSSASDLGAMTQGG